ncbi:hypothetical protein FRC11_002944 [Ceratobasidium sp. 423]|nr:hypothetical protein FRC11_002944 [Ceratobasidium sp. 423]
MELLHQMVSNLSINAFACNFCLLNSEANQDVVEVNYLNTCIYECLSVTKVEENVYGKPLFIQSMYILCADLFKLRLSIIGEQDLDTIMNCVISPFPTVANFTKSVMGAFKTIADEEIRTHLFKNMVNDACLQEPKVHQLLRSYALAHDYPVTLPNLPSSTCSSSTNALTLKRNRN